MDGPSQRTSAVVSRRLARVCRRGVIHSSRERCVTPLRRSSQGFESFARGRASRRARPSDGPLRHFAQRDHDASSALMMRAARALSRMSRASAHCTPSTPDRAARDHSRAIREGIPTTSRKIFSDRRDGQESPLAITTRGRAARASEAIDRGSRMRQAEKDRGTPRALVRR